MCLCVCVLFRGFCVIACFFSLCRFGIICICVFVFECVSLNFVCLGEFFLVLFVFSRVFLCVF